MRRLTLVLGLLLGAVPALGQTTSVSGTITDAGGQAWAFGTVQFRFRPSDSNPTGQYFFNGAPFDKSTTIPAPPLPLDSTGSFSGVVVPSNTSITPSGSTWTVQVCPAATTPCSSQNLTITGGSENISAFIIPPAINLNLSVPLLGARTYTDAEVSGALPGTLYFNLTDNRLHVCLQTGFPPCTWFVLNGGLGTVTNFSAGNLSPLFTTSVANPTTIPALTFSLSNAPAGTIYGNPSGGSAAPGFFAPSSFSGVGTGTVTSFSAGTANPFFVTTVNTPTTTPQLLFNINTQPANCVFSGPTSGGSATPTCRSLVGADLPNPGPTLGTGKGGVNSHAAVTHQFLTQIGTDGSVLGAQPTAGDITGLGTTQIESFTFCFSGCTVTGTPCTTGNTGNAECTNTITWPSSFADSNYAVSCQGIGRTNFPFIPFVTKAAGTVTVTTSTGENAAATNSSFNEIDCQGNHP